MNYRHAFHAGSFADVIKHIVLARMLAYLQEKPAPFRVIDTHAGAGRYDLAGDEARRSGEWLTGIARVMQARFSEAAQPLVGPYLDIVRAFNPPGELKAYPGQAHGFANFTHILPVAVEAVAMLGARLGKALRDGA